MAQQAFPLGLHSRLTLLVYNLEANFNHRWGRFMTYKGTIHADKTVGLKIYIIRQC